ncbi:Hypothetical Protein RRSL_00600 [Ralstonia solanacearum UW551]|nr:Hypothetical Protein RRSL_00600 [Ralstonia solanacearum UW551]
MRSARAGAGAGRRGPVNVCLNRPARGRPQAGNTPVAGSGRPVLRLLTPWANPLQTAVHALAMPGVFADMDRTWDEIHVSGVPLISVKESRMKVAQSLAALIVAGAFAAPVFAAGTASAPAAAAPAAAPAAATTTEAASTPKAEAKHAKKHHHHKKAEKAEAKSDTKTDAASAPKAAEPAKQ